MDVARIHPQERLEAESRANNGKASRKMNKLKEELEKDVRGGGGETRKQLKSPPGASQLLHQKCPFLAGEVADRASITVLCGATRDVGWQ